MQNIPRAVIGLLLLLNNRNSSKNGSVTSMDWNILVADDSADDQFLITRAMKKAGAACVMYTVDDGAEAISYLSGMGQYADRGRFPFPDLLLLDLKMPRLGG